MKREPLLINSKYANVSITIVFRVDSVPQLDGQTGYAYRTASHIKNAGAIPESEIIGMCKEIAAEYDVPLATVHPITAQEAALLEAPLSGYVN